MSFHRYPVTALEKISQHIRSLLVIPSIEAPAALAEDSDDEDDGPTPESLDDLGDLFRVADMPEDNLPAPNTSGRWFLSTMDPAETVVKLPGLWVRAGIRMVTYLNHAGESGTGVTLALPSLFSTTEQLEAAISQADKTGQPPAPDQALPNILDAIEGDGSLSSFLAASIFAREIKEFGRFGKHSRWQHHRFVSAVPPKVQWQWRAKQPEDLTPKVVTTADEHVVVEFFSCRVQKPIALFRHVDRYPPNSYCATTKDQVLAVMAGTGK